MQGKIVKGIAGFYYVHVVESGVYECKAKGIFRKDGVKPLVGDNVEIEVLDEEEKKGNIREILTRKNELIRPAVAAAFPGAKVVDGNEGVVRHLKEVLEEAGLRNPRAAGGHTRLITTGDEGIYLPLFDRMLERARPFAL